MPSSSPAKIRLKLDFLEHYVSPAMLSVFCNLFAWPFCKVYVI